MSLFFIRESEPRRAFRSAPSTSYFISNFSPEKLQASSGETQSTVRLFAPESEPSDEMCVPLPPPSAMTSDSVLSQAQAFTRENSVFSVPEQKAFSFSNGFFAGSKAQTFFIDGQSDIAFLTVSPVYAPRSIYAP